MTARIGSAFSSNTLKHESEAADISSTSDEDDNMSEQTECGPTIEGTTDAVAQPQSSFLWRVSSGALGGVYNVATGAAGMGYNGTKWVLGKGVEIGSNVAEKSKDLSGNVITKTAKVGSSIVSVIPLPSKLKGKDKKE